MEGKQKKVDELIIGFIILAIETFLFVAVDSRADHNHLPTDVLSLIVGIFLAIGWVWMLQFLLSIIGHDHR